ncbi:MAG: hypothetical protein M3P84_05125 [Chloroflexota bacterium]|nr:hypothetical protein [Chloroflexota bacterium]
MAKRSKYRPGAPAEVEPRPEDDTVDDVVAFGKVAGDQAATGLPQGIVWPLIVYAIARAIGALGRYLRGGRRLP